MRQVNARLTLLNRDSPVEPILLSSIFTVILIIPKFLIKIGPQCTYAVKITRHRYDFIEGG